MAKIRTSIFEMLLNELLEGKTLYDDNGVDTIIVDKVRFHPKSNTVFASNIDGDTYSFFIDDTIDIEMTNGVSNVLDKTKIKKLQNKPRFE
jgi:hypothetical protein